jgi:hypothetical protein
MASYKIKISRGIIIKRLHDEAYGKYEWSLE